MVYSLNNGASAGNVNGNEYLKLLYNTVTKGNAELFDNIVIKLLYQLKILVFKGMLRNSLLKESGKIGMADS